MSNTIKNTVVAGVFVVLATVAGAIITTYKWSDKPKSENLPITITGIVVESGNNKEIGQALVSIVGRTEQATTRDNGNFRVVMPVESPSFVTLRVTKSGYQPYEENVHVPAEGLTIQMRKQ
jgi:hypothetical protein